MKKILLTIVMVVLQWIGWTPTFAPAADPLLVGDYVGRHMATVGAQVGIVATPEQTWEEYRQHRMAELMEQIDDAYRELQAWRNFEAEYLAEGNQQLADYCATNAATTEALIADLENELMNLMGL